MITTPEIIAEEEDRLGLPAGAILDGQRSGQVVEARHRAIWRCRYDRGMGIRQIAKAFNLESHRSVFYAIRKIDTELRSSSTEIPRERAELSTRKLGVNKYKDNDLSTYPQVFNHTTTTTISSSLISIKPSLKKKHSLLRNNISIKTILQPEEKKRETKDGD